MPCPPVPGAGHRVQPAVRAASGRLPQRPVPHAAGTGRQPAQHGARGGFRPPAGVPQGPLSW